jgi:hypothetical protein
MRRVALGAVLVSLALASCNSSNGLVGVNGPAAPQNVNASYYGGVVTVTWDLAADWNGESFRVYAKRATDRDYLLIAEVSSCAEGTCAYEDRNILAGQTYDYYVASVDPSTGAETASDQSVEVSVPQPVPPPIPTGLEAIGLDGVNYLRWSDNARSASDFSFYRVYLDAPDGTQYLLGNSDSEGFLDTRAVNGVTSTYYVTAVDDQGNESAASAEASATSRPDYHGEWVYAYSDQPSLSGFRFQNDESTDPIVSGTSADRDFRLEVDASGWWLVPSSLAVVYPTGFTTTALRCGVGADASCVDLPVAPTSGYTQQKVALTSQTSYALRVQGDDGKSHYAVIRVDMLGFDQTGNALMVFDWAYQLQPGNPSLAPAGRVVFTTP